MRWSTPISSRTGPPNTARRPRSDHGRTHSPNTWPSLPRPVSAHRPNRELPRGTAKKYESREKGAKEYRGRCATVVFLAAEPIFTHIYPAHARIRKSLGEMTRKL